MNVKWLPEALLASSSQPSSNRENARLEASSRDRSLPTRSAEPNRQPPRDCWWDAFTCFP